jgi:hypothetical protein
MDSPTSYSHRRQTLAALAALAIVGQAVLMASAWLLPAVSEYRLVTDSISELVLGRYGLVQTAAFVIAGIGILGLAWAVGVTTASSRGSVMGALLMVVWGAGAILSAMIPTDRIETPADVWSQSTTGTVHVIISLIAFPSAIAAMFLFTRTFAREPRWRPLAFWSGLLASAALALFFVQGQGPWVGIMQRLLVATISTWLVVVAVKVRGIASLEPA